MSHLKARALKQLINKPKQPKHIIPPTQATQQHHLQVLQITQNCQDKYSRLHLANSTSTPEQHVNCIGATREESRPQGTFLIEKERDARWVDDSSAKMMKGDAAQDQRVLEAPRAKDDEESMGEMVQRLTNKIDKIMETPIWKLEPPI